MQAGASALDDRVTVAARGAPALIATSHAIQNDSSSRVLALLIFISVELVYLKLINSIKLLLAAVEGT